ncbi:hypothetical protein EWH99_12445 [Sporolactobacillus sp. THM7-7]|nr:hypothetical protein EWH99_12445 [Sporolactobacillus sp. THM7-7]
MLGFSLAHWVYAVITVFIIVIMVLRKDIVLPTIIGTFLVGACYKFSIIDGFATVFNASLVAAKELFNIFLIIAIMAALLKALKDLGADEKMIAPIQKVMVNGHIAFFTLFVVTYAISLFFWPTPAVPLICSLLVPAAIRAGLPAMAGAMAVTIAGQGMALSSDYIMQVAPSINAKAAGIDTSAIADKSMILSLITGGFAVAAVYVTIWKSIKSRSEGKKKAPSLARGLGIFNSGVTELATAAQPQVIKEYRADLTTSTKQGNTLGSGAELAATAETSGIQSESKERWGRLFAVITPIVLLAIVLYMFSTKLNSNMSGLEGGDGAAFIGGIASLLIILASLCFWRMKALDKFTEYLTDGFLFAFRTMAPIIPIAGFFFLGSADFSGSILGVTKNAPSFLLDLVQAASSHMPQNSFLAAFIILIVGLITGLDGSGFSGLSLVGALSGAITGSSGIDSATLAAIGQMGAIWSGGGAIIAWSSLVAVASFCGVNPMDLARKNFIPVMLGLVISTICAVLIW